MSEPPITLRCGDALSVLRTLESESVHCCVTSPPYFGLRDYGTATWVGGLPDCDHVYNHGAQGKTGQRAGRTFTAQDVYRTTCGKCEAHRIDGQLGLERTYPEYIARLVDIFREVRRVLRPDATAWINLGDSYATGAGGVGDCPGGGAQGDRWKGFRGHPVDKKRDPSSIPIGPMTQANRLPQPDLKPKDLMMIPARVAIALQADGWYLRSDIVWSKRNPMPESVQDRPTKSHEYLFLLAKSEKYYYDADAIAEPSVSDHGSGNGFKREARLSYLDGNGPRGNDQPWMPNGKHSSTDPQASGRRITESVARARAEGAPHDSPFGSTRNRRTVWEINTQPYPEAHFATFPEDLVKPCILAGCPEGGIVLDPFAGSGTVGVVALKNGRGFLGIELNPSYVAMALRRINAVAPLFQEEVSA